MHHGPEELLTILHEDLTPFTRELKGTLSVAADPWNFLELLAEAPQGWRLVLHWAGDENQMTEVPGAAINKSEFHVGITCNLGLTAKPGEAVMRKRPGNAPSLLRLMTMTRDRVKSFVFPDGTSGQAIYLGADPITLPDGTPLAGYRLRFSLMSADEPVTPRG